MARSFDESDDAVYFADNALWTLPAADWAMMFWVNITDNAGSLFQYWFSWAPNASPFASPSVNVWVYEASEGNAGRVDLDVFGAGGDEAWAQGTTGDLSTNTWHCVVCQREGDDFNVYVDNVLKATVTNAAVGEINVGEQVDFGRRSDSDGDRFFGGYLGDFAKWDQALTSAERAALAAGASPGEYPTNLKLWVEFRGLESPEPERTGSGLTGTLVSAPSWVAHPSVGEHGAGQVVQLGREPTLYGSFARRSP
jgi:hypothetical protein